MDSWELPELYCPFPSAVNRYAESVGQRTVEWGDRLGIFSEPYVRRRLEAVGVGWLIGRAYPFTAQTELQILTDWCTWLFLQDDQCDERGIGKNPAHLAHIHARSLAVLSGDSVLASDPALTRALTDLRERIHEIAPPGWMPRFLSRVKDAFDGSVWEAHNRAQNRLPPLEEYLHYRAHTGGVYTLTELVEVTERLSLPIEIYDHPDMKALTRHAVNVVCWSNDIVSLAKELHHGDFHNLILILQARHQIPIQEAIYRAAALHDAEVRTFMDLEGRMPSFGTPIDAGVRGYIRILKAWMRGNLDWSYLSGRYMGQPPSAAKEIERKSA